MPEIDVVILAGSVLHRWKCLCAEMCTLKVHISRCTVPRSKLIWSSKLFCEQKRATMIQDFSLASFHDCLLSWSSGLLSLHHHLKGWQTLQISSCLLQLLNMSLHNRAIDHRMIAANISLQNASKIFRTLVTPFNAFVQVGFILSVRMMTKWPWRLKGHFAIWTASAMTHSVMSFAKNGACSMADKTDEQRQG